MDKFEPVSSKVDFAGIEAGILKFWEEEDVFRRSIEERRGGPEYVFYDGPPFATGLPHYGHLLAGTIKDIVPRYQTMRGRCIERRFGWDCHGLPVEYEVEQDLGISGKTDIEKMGVGVFNEACRSIVLRYTSEWRRVVTRMGRWVDFDKDYKTMDPSYMESIWWVFKSLWEKGLVYQGQKILPYCPRCSTPLSNFEANQGYEDVTDPAITVRFAVDGEPGAYLLAWTTTPWTLPSNLALAVGPEMEYARVQEKEAVYYIAKARLGAYYKKEGDYESVTFLKGSELVGRCYAPLFPWFAGMRAQGAFRVIGADFVSTEDGTGIVHIAPGFGEDDYAAGQKEGLPCVCPVDAEGRFTDEVRDYAGRRVKETDNDIIAALKAGRHLVHRSTIAHSYPHCWRCDTALIYKGVSTWFVSVTELKERLIAANSAVHWVPGHLRDGRFGKWIEGARDWAISRNRYWGTPLPVWASADGKERVCVGSIEELEKLSGKRVSDLHKHHVDALVIPSPSGNGVLRRVPEVLDCWFESGAMPYAQAHYPFENKARFERNFPADFIAEGLDQTRGWFYTLMVLSTALFDRPAFRNVVVNGLVLAEDGRKMSKRLKNYPDPTYMLDTYGADALRLYLINSPVVRAEDLRFSEEGVRHVLRHLLIPLWNAYSFFVTYANVDGWRPSGDGGRPSSPHLLDRWIMSSLDGVALSVAEAMDDYELQRAVRPFVGFMEDLTNWYIRRSRRRFWKSRSDEDKENAYATLHYVLLTFSQIAAPFVPFLGESMYRNLRTQGMPDSVHLCRFPAARDGGRDVALEEEMSLVMTIVRLGRSLRSENDLKVRQPLRALHVVSRNRTLLERARRFEDLVSDELNVKQIVHDDRDSSLAELKAKPDFKSLGPRLGPRVKKAAGVMAKLGSAELDDLASGKETEIVLDGEKLVLGPGDVVIERIPRTGMVVAADGELVVALETALDEELIVEGLAREFVNKVQTMRKNADLEVTDRIDIEFDSDEMVKTAVGRHGEYVAGETLSLSCVPAVNPENAEEWDLNGRPARIAIRKSAD
ncbi:MAG: isoleucine--tRNA ligase [Lentisphaerae bacterium]|nr:isoleucine--tRNA ligase [Lentisphaerota bacterium]